MFILAWINFLLWWHITLFLGGTPDYEKSHGGTYYLSSHSQLTEVTEQTFIFVEYYTIFTFGLIIVAFVMIVISHIVKEGFVIK